MSRVGPTGRIAALAMALVLVFALAGSGVGTDTRLGDSEVANVPVVVFGAAADDPQSDLVGTPLTLTFEGLTSETVDWPDGFAAATDEASTASFSVASTDGPEESTETPTEPQYVVRLDSVGSDSVRFTLAGGEQTAATVAVHGDLLTDAFGLSAFDPASVELRVDGVVTGYDTTADGVVQFRTPDWADRPVTFRVVEGDAPASDSGTDSTTEETPTEESTTEQTPTEETPTEEAPTGETPTEETSTEESSEETTTEQTPTEEAPSEETPTEETTTEETSTEESSEKTTTEEAPTEETTTEEISTESPAETTPTETADDTPTESTTTTDQSTPADTESSQTPDGAGA